MVRLRPLMVLTLPSSVMPYPTVQRTVTRVSQRNYRGSFVMKQLLRTQCTWQKEMLIHACRRRVRGALDLIRPMRYLGRVTYHIFGGQ
ncbi:hypothetical protein BDZ91DRAFT_715166 [Kalaharituber pfeilii]|nr:hypothetical protein BDZ91DRAFT_715166 [Kalaharituber pfeilii]